MSIGMHSNYGQVPNDLAVLTYNTHLFKGSNADYANKARIEIAKLFPWTKKLCPRIFDDIPNIVYDDDNRAQHILDNLRDCGADIVALQEVWACNRQTWFENHLKLNDIYPYSYHYAEHCKFSVTSPDQIIELLKKFLGKLNYQDANPKAVEDAYQKAIEPFKNTSGLLLLSKYPLEKPEFHEFQPGRTGVLEDSLARKGVIAAIVKLPDGSKFRVGITHANTDTGAKEDIPDLQDLAKWTSNGTDPEILMGDFNVGDNNYKKMADFFKKTYGAIDAYREATGKEFNDPTSDHETNKLYPKFSNHLDLKKECIDYVFLRPNSSRLKLKPKPESTMVIKNWMYGDDQMDLSDHYPLKVTFDVTRE
jgi:endonuclease/exonuclease/phosphatase family metal-dependent hydrolase